MKTFALLARTRSVGLLCVATLALPLAVSHAQEWRNDIQYASTTTKTADDAAGSPVGDDAMGDCGPQPYCSCERDACDELQARIQASAKCMAQQGIIYAPGVTQFYQGVAGGGREQDFDYGGKVDQYLILDGTKLGVWDGMTMTMHVETRFGEDVNFDAVGFAPANVAMLYPKEGEHDTAITGLTFDQKLDEDLHATYGKFNALDMFYSLYPETGRGINGFMNTSMVIPLACARTVPLSFMGAGLTVYKDKQAEGGVLVFDPQNCTTTSGFDDMFDNGANIMGYWRFFTDVNGLPGSHYFGGIWSTGEFVSFDPTGFVIVPGQGIVVDRVGGAFTLLYIYEQTLWMDCCNKKRNVTLLSQWGLADQETSPVSWSANIGIQGTGFNRSRPDDSVGVGYFHTGVSDDLKTALTPFFDLHDVDGVELYYNAAVKKFFHVTADFQVIEPADSANNTALVFGLRGTLGM
jgi:porin